MRSEQQGEMSKGNGKMERALAWCVAGRARLFKEVTARFEKNASNEHLVFFHHPLATRSPLVGLQPLISLQTGFQ